jgi:hypothetical protein
MAFNPNFLSFDNPNAPYGRAQTFQPWKFKLQPMVNDDEPAPAEQQQRQQPPAVQENSLQEEQDDAAPLLQEQPAALKQQGGQQPQSADRETNKRVRFALGTPPQQNQAKDTGRAKEAVQQQGGAEQRKASSNLEVQRPAKEDAQEESIAPPVFDEEEEQGSLAPLNEKEEPLAPHSDDALQAVGAPESLKDYRPPPSSPPKPQEAVPSPSTLRQDGQGQGEDVVEHDSSFRKTSTTERNEHKWQESFRELRQHREQHGHVRMSKKLSNWLSSQRCYSLNENSFQKLKCAATRERRRLQLQSIGVTFPAGQQLAKESHVDWETRFAELECFKQKFGHVIVPASMPYCPKLARWLMKQRFWYLSDRRLAAQPTEHLETRRSRLEALGVTFSASAEQPQVDIWETRFADLERFQQKYGHVIVPASMPDYPKLARWLMKQRFWYLSDRRLAAQPTAHLKTRRSRLEALGVAFSASAEPNTE